MTKKVATIEKLEKGQMKQEVPTFHIGDTVRVHVRVIERDRQRVQVFQGTVIGRQGGGLSETFTVHRVAFGEGMTRTFLLHSPRVEKVEVVRHGRVRRAKLTYLLGKTGKKARVRAHIGKKTKAV